MRILSTILALALCAGCAKETPRYGNQAGADSAELAQDVVFVMFETYPPAQTRLALVQAADDGFGVGLVEALRLHGYAIADYVEPAKKGWGAPKAVNKPDGIPFAYLIAGTGVEKEIRVVIHIGSESLSRLYRVEGEGTETRYVSQGFWSHRRDDGEAAT